MSKKVTRLFTQFQPKNYVLDLVPDREKMTFSGVVTITGKKVGRPTKRITLHQKYLKITQVTIVKMDKSTTTVIEVSRVNSHSRFDELRLHTAETLYPGEYEIEINFRGKITRPMQGIYPCFFKHNGQDKMLIATQFESHHAREAFPCVDEPEAKATIDLTLTTPVGETVISNTEIKNQKTIKNSLVTLFETTPIMSTYLLAFVYGPLHAVTAKSKRGIKVASWATVAQPKAHLQYANDEAVKLLDFFEDYFQIPFPLKKLDQVALPDFDSLAMENWGLITFREVGLLADPINRSISGERLITMVVAHELSHQWFGNLVTMKWWDDLWLNESFASIMESLAPDKLHPDWQEWEDFTSSRVVAAANRDIYKDVQPVGVKVDQPDEILSLFDPSIVYAKGARILKMLFDYIGEEAFRQGLTSYFKKYAYKNTDRNDLWKELGKASGLDINSLMTPWIEQSGTPELSVVQKGVVMTISQSRFLLDAEDNDSVWPVPLLSDQELSRSLKPQTLPKKTTAIEVIKQIRTTSNLLSGKEQRFTKPDASPLLLNPSGSGHYIVNYQDEAIRNELIAKIINRTLVSTGRIISINDMLLLTQKGKFGLTDVLDLVSQCSQEDREAVWSVIIRAIGTAQQLTDDHDDSEKLITILKRTMSDYWYDLLGWNDKPGDDPNTKQLRSVALALSLAGESQPAIAEALKRMNKAKIVDALPAEQRGIIAGAVVRFGKPEWIQKLLDEYVSSPNPDVQQAIAAALCTTKDPKVAKKIVMWGMYDDEIIRPQDIDHWFAYLMRNRYTRQVAWDWLVDRWPHLMNLYGEGKKMEYFIWYASKPISSTTWQKRYHQFFDPKAKDASMKRNILISFSEIQARVDWRNRDSSKIAKWLRVNIKVQAKS